MQRAEMYSRALLDQALRTQTDIDESYQCVSVCLVLLTSLCALPPPSTLETSPLLVGQDALRNEKQQRQMLKDHIRSITYVVKALSNELDVTEDRCMGALSALKQSVCAGSCDL